MGLFTDTLKASGAQTTATTGSGKTMPYLGPGKAYIDVTAASGTAKTLGVWFEGRRTNSDNWAKLVTAGGTVISSPAITTTGSGTKGRTVYGGAIVDIPSIPNQIRYRSSHGGTSPSFTYSVVLEANQGPK